MSFACAKAMNVKYPKCRPWQRFLNRLIMSLDASSVHHLLNVLEEKLVNRDELLHECQTSKDSMATEFHKTRMELKRSNDSALQMFELFAI